jgi:predicted short-subunit dehydrogenase-like oxidoreductase (DUF2520 family)
MLRRMARRPRVVIVGAGNLGCALALSLHGAGYAIEALVVRSRGMRLNRAQKLASEIGAVAIVDLPSDLRAGRLSALSAHLPKKLRAEIVWFSVPDAEIAVAARTLADKIDWKKKVALHSSGTLTSDELAVLHGCGAAVASVHPMMTFVHGSRPLLSGVPFAIEGDAAAVRVARGIVSDVGGDTYVIRKKDKAAYHAWAMFASPLFTALLAAAERVAKLAGVPKAEARRRMVPILSQTLANYAKLGAAEALSGPIVRGDADTVKRHLRVLRDVPQAREVYSALAKAALRYLPSKRRKDLAQLLRE